MLSPLRQILTACGVSAAVVLSHLNSMAPNIISPNHAPLNIIPIPSPTATPVLSLGSLEQKARTITVRILVGDIWGSGILWKRQGSYYYVLTNQHVLEGVSSYKIETYTHQQYTAKIPKDSTFKHLDLGVLVFDAGQDTYPLAVLGRAQDLALGEPLLSVGFPLQLEAKVPSLKIAFGQVIYALPKSFESGYQLGFSSHMVKGMSGGPVLNQTGEVVAINGVHAEALWGDPYIFDDGADPCLPLKQLMRQNSWGIPIERAIGSSFTAIDVINAPSPSINFDPFLSQFPEAKPIVPYPPEWLNQQAQRVSQCLEEIPTTPPTSPTVP